MPRGAKKKFDGSLLNFRITKDDDVSRAQIQKALGISDPPDLDRRIYRAGIDALLGVKQAGFVPSSLERACYHVSKLFKGEDGVLAQNISPEIVRDFIHYLEPKWTDEKIWPVVRAVLEDALPQVRAALREAFEPEDERRSREDGERSREDGERMLIAIARAGGAKI